MEYRRLGTSELHVSEIALGSWLTLGGGVERERGVACIERAFSLSQLALAWVLREPNVAAAIVGVSRPKQLDENAGASGISLDEATVVAIDAALAGVVVGPG